MRLFGFGLAFLCMAVVGTADAQTVTVLDDFNGPGGGSGFTQTVILDTDASTTAADSFGPGFIDGLQKEALSLTVETAEA